MVEGDPNNLLQCGAKILQIAEDCSEPGCYYCVADILVYSDTLLRLHSCDYDIGLESTLKSEGFYSVHQNCLDSEHFRLIGPSLDVYGGLLGLCSHNGIQMN